jgi:hypothetical protein
MHLRRPSGETLKPWSQHQPRPQRSFQKGYKTRILGVVVLALAPAIVVACRVQSVKIMGVGVNE